MKHSPNLARFLLKNYRGQKPRLGRGGGERERVAPLNLLYRYGFRATLVIKSVYILLEKSGKGYGFRRRILWCTNVFYLFSPRFLSRMVTFADFRTIKNKTQDLLQPPSSPVSLFRFSLYPPPPLPFPFALVFIGLFSFSYFVWSRFLQFAIFGLK